MHAIFSYPEIVRLRVLPDEAADSPSAYPEGRPQYSGRPHGQAKLAEVRRLFEQTTLSYQKIAGKSGVSWSTVYRWARDGGWQRHPLAQRATDSAPSARAGQKYKLRRLA